MGAIPHRVRQFGGTKSLLRRNQYGATGQRPGASAAEPYDGRGRTFFSSRSKAPASASPRVRSSPCRRIAQRESDFSDLVDNAGAPVTIYDPATTRPRSGLRSQKSISADNPQYLRDPFPGNRIPLSRLDPVARLAGGDVSADPTRRSGRFLANNYWINSPNENRADGIISKARSITLTAKQQMSTSVPTTSRGIRRAPEYFPGPANSGAGPAMISTTAAFPIRHAYTASPRVVWTFRGSAS
jgi:hypothetical protein